MKNLKTLLVTGGLMGVMMIGVTSAKAGIIIIGGKAQEETTATQQCTEANEEKSIIGIILTDLKGLLVSDGSEVDNTTNCEETTSVYGLLVSD